MTAILRILERFTVQVEEPADKWFLDYVLRSPKEAGKHLTAGWHAMNRLKDVYRFADDIASCREWFGGMGAQALMAERLFNLESHVVQEYSQDAVGFLDETLPRRIEVLHRDAYDDTRYSPDDYADLQILDYGDLTVRKLAPGEERRALLEHVVSLRPKAILLTDIACRYLHLHVATYERQLGSGSCADYPTYLEALGEYVSREFGYTPLRGYWDRWSTVMALVPTGWADDSNWLFPTPAEPVGLEVF